MAGHRYILAHDTTVYRTNAWPTDEVAVLRKESGTDLAIVGGVEYIVVVVDRKKRRQVNGFDAKFLRLAGGQGYILNIDPLTGRPTARRHPGEGAATALSTASKAAPAGSPVARQSAAPKVPHTEVEHRAIDRKAAKRAERFVYKLKRARVFDHPRADAPMFPIEYLEAPGGKKYTRVAVTMRQPVAVTIKGKKTRIVFLKLGPKTKGGVAGKWIPDHNVKTGKKIAVIVPDNELRSASKVRGALGAAAAEAMSDHPLSKEERERSIAKLARQASAREGALMRLIRGTTRHTVQSALKRELGDRVSVLDADARQTLDAALRLAGEDLTHAHTAKLQRTLAMDQGMFDKALAKLLVKRKHLLRDATAFEELSELKAVKELTRGALEAEYERLHAHAVRREEIRRSKARRQRERETRAQRNRILQKYPDVYDVEAEEKQWKRAVRKEKVSFISFVRTYRSISCESSSQFDSLLP